MVSPEMLVDDLIGALGEETVSQDRSDLLAYGHDVFPLALKQAGQGRPFALPEVVVFPHTAGEIAEVVRIARRHRTPVVPYGGGSGIVGGALPVGGGIVVELKGLASIGEIDTISRLVSVGAGLNGQRLEDHLNERGFTTGHYPQSLRSSTVGGWVAHRAIGTASTRYGGIETIVAGLEVVLPDGEILRLKALPRTATGPDLRQLFLGSEGTLGIVTEVTLRIRPLPAAREWLVFTFDDFAAGLEAVRGVVQADLRPAIVRLYDELEAEHLLQSAGLEPGGCLLLMDCEGDTDSVRWEAGRIKRFLSTNGSPAPEAIAERWWQGRFSTRGLLTTLHKPLGVADALEVAAPWRYLADTYQAMRREMTAALGSSGVVYGHTSHAYADGANLYMIFHGQAAQEDGLAEYYERVLAAAFRACVDHGGTISHHHGIGLGKARWMEWEIGAEGMCVLRAVQQALDPEHLLNPGKLGAEHHA